MKLTLKGVLEIRRLTIKGALKFTLYMRIKGRPHVKKAYPSFHKPVY